MESNKGLLRFVAACAVVAGCSSDLPTFIEQPAVASIEITPRPAEIVAGDSIALSIVARDSVGAPIGDIEVLWQGLHPATARVSRRGVVHGMRLGVAEVSASLGDLADTISLTVLPGGIVLSPDRIEVLVGETANFAAAFLTSDGRPVGGSANVTWTSSNQSVGVVPSAVHGSVQSLAAGTTVLTAVSGAAEGSAVVTVSDVAVASVEIRGGEGLLVAGTRLQLSARVLDAGGNILGRRRVDWSSGNLSVARVDDFGEVRLFGGGTVEIVATSFPAADTVLLTVEPGFLTLDADSFAVVIGTGTTVTSSLATVSWSSADSAIVGITGAGNSAVLTFDNPGRTVVTARTPGQVRSLPVEVARVAWMEAGTFGGHTCATTASLHVYCWGRADRGQLGVQERPATWILQPYRVLGQQAFAAVATGTEHSCALTENGDGYCWGTGLLGDGAVSDRELATGVTANVTFVALSAADNYTCAVGVDGGVYCWGRSIPGLGTAGLPQRMELADSMVGVATAPVHTCALSSSGAAYCWGAGTFGKLGNGASDDTDTPVLVAGGLVFESVSAGWDHSCGLTSDSTAYCWGSDRDGQLGTDSMPCGPLTCDVDRSERPVRVDGGFKFGQLSAGGDHTCGIDQSGAAYCWGRNSDGALGDGTTTASTTPVPVAGGISFRSLATGSRQTCGVAVDDRLYCWGSNSDGQLGNGTLDHSAVPVEVPGV